MVDFRRYTKPILEVLKDLGVEDAKFEGRNDLTIGGKKFSGNAEHIFKNKVLHHGTLLFSSEMRDVSGALKVNPLKYKDRAVKSVPKRVTNINSHLKEDISLEQFTDKIMDYILENYENARMYEFTEEDFRAIEKIKQEKYGKWEWNFGYSPDYNFKQGVKSDGGLIEMNMNVSEGNIKDVKIQGDFFHLRDIEPIERALEGTRHDENEIRKVFKKFDLKNILKT